MAEEKEPLDWLWPTAEQEKEKATENALVFAQKYLVFEQDPRARDLLAYWTGIARRKRIHANATVQEYAAHNAFREMIEGIHAQIEFAKNGQNVPKPRTT
jgi:hypothetical protein